MRIRILFLILIVFSTRILSAQVSVNAKTDKGQYLIGDYIRVQLSVTADSTFILDWPSENEIAPYDVISGNPIDTTRINNSFQLNQQIVYSIYDSGKYYIPSITIPYKKFRDTATYFALSDSVLFTVTSVAVDTTTAIKPIKEVLEVKAKNYLWIYIVCGVILLAGIAVVIYFVFFKNKITVEVKEKKPSISYYDKTIQLLQALDAKKLWQKDDLKGYYSELTEIIRSYLEKRFNINALESTSDEILSQLSNLQVAALQKENIRYILELADLAKFAKSQPLANENLLALQNAFTFVESTKPVELKAEEKK